MIEMDSNSTPPTMQTATLLARLREYLTTTASPFSSATGLLREAVDALNAMHATIANLQADRSMVIADTAALGQSIINDRDATIAKLKEQKASIISTLEDMGNEIADRKQDAADLRRDLDAARKDRASIVAFLTAEAVRFDKAAREFDEQDMFSPAADRCRTKAGHTRSLASQIERGDDRQGGE